MASATSFSLELVNQSLGPLELKAPKDRILPIRPSTVSSRPPMPFTIMLSNTLNRFSGRSKMASIRLPMASSMPTTRSSIHLREMISVMASRMPVTKFLMPCTRSSISLGIWATIPMIPPSPLDNTPDRLPPILPSALPIVPDSVVPIVFAMPSPICGSMESSVPFSWSICPTDC